MIFGGEPGQSTRLSTSSAVYASLRLPTPRLPNISTANASRIDAESRVGHHQFEYRGWSSRREELFHAPAADLPLI
jgi:hypothetical protein